MNIDTNNHILLFIYGLAAYVITSYVTTTFDGFNKKIIDKLPEKLYEFISGFPILHQKSIKLYKEAILHKYSEIRIPFRDEPLNLQDIYVPLRLYHSLKTEKIESKEAVKKFDRIVVVGELGSGKSTMLKHLLVSFIEDLSKFPNSLFPIFLEVSTLANSNSTYLFDDLLSTLNNYNFINGKKFLERLLNEGNLIIFMDGLDEVNKEKRKEIVAKIEQLVTKYTKVRFVITCRSEVYNDELFNIPHRQILEVVEFEDKQISQFLEYWKEKLPENKSVNQLLKTLHDTPRIMELARNPLMLTIIAYLYCNPNYELPHSRAEFYKQACNVLLNGLHPDINDSKYLAASKKEILKHLALFNQDTEEENRKIIDHKLIIRGIENVSKSNGMEREDPHLILKDIVERSGLLISIDGGDSYQFAHLSLQEYFAAEALGNNQKAILTRYNKYKETWRETVKLWCGFGYDCTILIEGLYKINSTFAFECLADASKVDNELADKIITEFKLKIIEQTSLDTFQKDTILKGFGSFASNIKSKRGSEIFEFLVVTLENESLDTSVRQGAAFSLSTTNLPKAASVLARNFFTFEECRSLLIKMGDFIVPALENESSSVSSVPRIKIFREVGTPFAAKSIVPYLWDNNSEVAYTAAWSLSSLIKDKNIEKELSGYQFQNGIDQQTLDWVWSPFEDVEHSSLSKICGRIGFILDTPNTFNSTLDLFENSKIDERISIPLFVSNMYFSKCYNDICEISGKNDPWSSDFELFYYGRSNKIQRKEEIIRKVYEDIKAKNYLKVKDLSKRKNYPCIFFDCMDEILKLKMISIILFERPVSVEDWTNIRKESKLESESIFFKIPYQSIIMIMSTPLTIISLSYGTSITLNSMRGHFIFLSHLSEIISSHPNLSFLPFLILLLPCSLFISKIIEDKDDFLPNLLCIPVWIPIIIANLLSSRNAFSFDEVWKYIIISAVTVISYYFLVRFMNEIISASFFEIIFTTIVITITVSGLKIISNIMDRELDKSTNPLREIILPIFEEKWFS
ncbi:hypothetical protein EO95_17380 [Methanosarcina sp. 1.H.T.1A.1]|uniref:NACHT domain-containing protein n=1 Tax=Methanosarcina sp. 1.H.T.1A.1 TaxID=1483602 RepID=UPI0006216824|nr:NACHT domain-containing protein [Methanosarcina sp. 1.H.T.1A.1]KKH93076.1 hypothetical protein EO95_17380 [Methanosarcina sp. 1.H.T.1A.1]